MADCFICWQCCCIVLISLLAQVFVGGVPRGATEDQIKEYASKVGPVRLLRAEILVTSANLKQQPDCKCLCCYAKIKARGACLQVHSCSLVKEPGSTGQNRGYGGFGLLFAMHFACCLHARAVCLMQVWLCEVYDKRRCQQSHGRAASD